MTSSPSVASADVAQYFFDTSALVKRYHKEDGTDQVTDVFAPADNLIRISTLGAVEIHSALAIKVRSGQLTRAAARILTDGVLADLASGRIKPYSVTDRHFAEAEGLVRQFSYDHRLRSLDAIQMSVALDLLPPESGFASHKGSAERDSPRDSAGCHSYSKSLRFGSSCPGTPHCSQARLIINVATESKNARRTSTASAGSAASTTAPSISLIQRSRAAWSMTKGWCRIRNRGCPRSSI
jgi:uncharacterized protein